MKETWADEIEITEDAEHKTAVVNFINCGKIQVDPEKDAICDLCNNVISKFKDMSDKNIVQPETVDRAINNGLVEESKLYSSILKTLRSHEKKLFVENLKAFLLQSETPWALCDSCLKMVNGYDTQNKQKNEERRYKVSDR